MNRYARLLLPSGVALLLACNSAPSTSRVEEDVRSYYAQNPPMGLHNGDHATVTSVRVDGKQIQGDAASALVSASGTTYCIFPDTPPRSWQQQKWFQYQKLDTGWVLTN